MADSKELSIQRGKTFTLDIFWANKDKIVRKPITGIDLSSGAPRLQITAHAIPDGIKGAITQVKGMRQINAVSTPPSKRDYHRATVVDSNTIELNALDCSGFSAYQSGGFFQYYEPWVLTGFTARMSIKDKLNGTLLASSEAGDVALHILHISVFPSLSKITLTISAAETAAIAWSKGVADFEIVSPEGVVTKLKLTSSGAETDPDIVSVYGEVTT